MSEIFDSAWTLWPTLREMSEATGQSYSTLAKRRSRGLMPPAEIDVLLIARAAQTGVWLDYEALATERFRLLRERAGAAIDGAAA